MGESGQRICRLAEEAANAERPQDALRLLCQLRRELEDFERRQAARALGQGDSFGAIARALGVSRQAAHRRFRDLAPATVDDGAEHPTPEARVVAEYALDEAAARGEGGVRSEHMLLAVLRFGDGRAASVLEEQGVTLEQAREAARGSGGTEDVLPTGRRISRAALGAARRHGAPAVDVEHLLLGALDDDRGGAAATLRALGVSVRAVRARLEAYAASAQPMLR